MARDRLAGLVARRELLGASGIEAALDRLAGEVLEANPPPAELLVVGVQTGGAHLAKRLVTKMAEKIGREVPLGVVDITLYRDDLFEGMPRPEVGPTRIPGEKIDGRVVILVDDVLYTGRTVRAALDELIDYGRPRRVRLAVLVDRGNRELPIQPDHAGLVVSTTRAQSVLVHLAEEKDSPDRVVLYEKADPLG